jgi:tetratricopeptide (TPR) repeat protein
MALGAEVEAKNQFREALRLNPDGYPAILALAQILAGQDSLKAADSLAHTAIFRFPAFREGHALLADLRRRAGSNPEDSSDSQRPAFGAFPDPYEDSLRAMGLTAFWHQERAQGHAARGEWDAAVAELREALRIRPEPENFGRLGEILSRSGKTQEAERALGRGLTAFPENPILLNTMGFVFASLRKAEEAIPWYRRAIQANPSDPAGYRNLALALAAAGRMDDARRHCRESLALFPGDAPLSEHCSAIQTFGKSP